MLPEFYQFHHPTKVIYGEGLVNDFAHELEELGVKNYFVVSDHVLSSLGLIQQIREGLEEAGFTEVEFEEDEEHKTYAISFLSRRDGVERVERRRGLARVRLEGHPVEEALDHQQSDERRTRDDQQGGPQLSHPGRHPVEPGVVSGPAARGAAPRSAPAGRPPCSQPARHRRAAPENGQRPLGRTCPGR